MTRRVVVRPTHRLFVGSGLVLAVIFLLSGCGTTSPTKSLARESLDSSGSRPSDGYGPAVANGFQPTKENASPAPGTPPDGMVWIPGGEFSMGAQDALEKDTVGMQATHDSRPIHQVYVDGFWMDKTDVTNEQFAAGAVVFSPPHHDVPLDNQYQWWSYVRGANWRHPAGPKSDIRRREKFPVVDVAYQDAEAYAKWADKRLPTEAEWEFAARGGLSGKRFVWGDEFRPQDKWMANTFQGHFPQQDTGADGHIGVTAVAEYPANGYGLFDMAGNVWQWVSDWYRPDYYQQLADIGGVARNPKGPTSPYDPSEPAERKRVMRGGSFLCTDQYCSRYMVGTRGKGEVSTGTNHLGFRCVKDVSTAR